ncbi:MAG TPA: RluA family pseudouridine synthase [Actinomycetota bacterium]
MEVEATPGRLDAVLAGLTGRPRADVQRAIVAGKVLVDGVARPKSHRLEGGERIQADLDVAATLEPEPGGLVVRFRDEHLLVVVKPPGMVTHATKAHRTGTLVNRLLGMGEALSNVDPERPGIVHRLDAGTSGLLIVARTDQAHHALVDMLKARTIHREYAALVRGTVEHQAFAVDAPLGRRGARVVLRPAGGVEASTDFSVTERLRLETLLAARPRTGRTHQIRVHLASIGHPILGDRRYGGGGDRAGALGLTRPFLHAARLSFDHPITGERIEIEEPLPPDLEEALARARAPA